MAGNRHQLTSGRKYASPSQGDKGTIVALGDDNHLYHFSRAGKPLGKPVPTWLGLGGGNGFRGRIEPVCPPTAARSRSRSCTSRDSSRSGGTGRSKASRATRTPAATPRPACSASSQGIRTSQHGSTTGTRSCSIRGPPTSSPAASTSPITTRPRRPTQLDDMHHAFTWFDDPVALPRSSSGTSRGKVTSWRPAKTVSPPRARFASTRSRAALRSRTMPPPTGAGWRIPPGTASSPSAGRPTASRSPVYQAGGGIYTVHVGNVSAAAVPTSAGPAASRGGRHASHRRGARPV